jgi:hypothetical protein
MDDNPPLQDCKLTLEIMEPLIRRLEDSQITSTHEENLTGNNELDLLCKRCFMMEILTLMSQLNQQNKMWLINYIRSCKF